MGSTFGGTWEDPGGCFFKFTVKRALKQDQIVHMEENFNLFATSAGSEFTFLSSLVSPGNTLNSAIYTTSHLITWSGNFIREKVDDSFN